MPREEIFGVLRKALLEHFSLPLQTVLNWTHNCLLLGKSVFRFLALLALRVPTYVPTCRVKKENHRT
jgi:hypothetical protein